MFPCAFRDLAKTTKAVPRASFAVHTTTDDITNIVSILVDTIGSFGVIKTAARARVLRATNLEQPPSTTSSSSK